MAEAAAVGGVIAYEVAETTVQVGAAGYAVAKPTLPLKASFVQIATATDDDTRYARIAISFIMGDMLDT